MVIIERAKDPRLQELKEEGVHVYSYSKLNCVNDCLLESWYSYIKHEPGLQSVYGLLGGASHQVTEDLIEGKATCDDLLPALHSALDECDTLGLTFPKDFRGNDSIKEKWIKDMTHFCQNFYPPRGKYIVEQLVILRVSPTRALQGYIDLTKLNDDGTVSVYDLKTSSRYKPSDLLEHGRQLVIYAMALEQAGYTVKNLAWIMLKYVEIRYTWYATSRSRNKTQCIRIVNRSKIYDTIAPAVESACRDAGMDEAEIEFAMLDFKETNLLGPKFPMSVVQQFIIKPFVEPYPYTPELKQEAITYINKVADVYESLPQDETTPWPARKVDKECAFFCNNLCSYRKICPAIRDYNAQALIADPPKTEADLF